MGVGLIEFGFGSSHQTENGLKGREGSRGVAKFGHYANHGDCCQRANGKMGEKEGGGRAGEWTNGRRSIGPLMMALA